MKPVANKELQKENIPAKQSMEQIDFTFNPIKLKVKKYNLRFPIDGMF